MAASIVSTAKSVRRTSKGQWRRFAFAAFVIGAVRSPAFSYPQAAAAHPQVYEFLNGHWFDGLTFRDQIWYSVGGILTARRPANIDEVIDLSGGYVVPPFGDAHNHNFDSPRTIAQDLESYLHDGIYYSMVLGDVRSGATAVRERVNSPTSVDVRYAHGVLTGRNSHPAVSYEARALGFFGRAEEDAHAAEIQRSHRLEDDAYYFIDTAADLDETWPRIIAERPDIIKVILLHSEEYDQRKARTGDGLGLDPALVPSIVRKAHDAGLKVAAHVDSAFDYHAALTAGVDIMAHLPGYYFRPDDVGRVEDVYALSAPDIRETAAKRVVVEPTANWADWETSPPLKARIRAMQVRNLRRLKEAGVTFAIGTDSYGLDSLKEAFYLETLGLFTNLELLKMWSEDTPRLIFPDRKIGAFKPGYEASFLVLEDNPLERFEATLNIVRRFKQGHELTSDSLTPIAR